VVARPRSRGGNKRQDDWALPRCHSFFTVRRTSSPLASRAGGAIESLPFSHRLHPHNRRRLLPELPRRGFRAVAGYFGHPVSEMRRASHHVEATAAVWASAVELLETKENVYTLEELDAWLDHSHRTTSPRLYPMPKKAREHLPDQPGVYTMNRAGGGILYVGKATSLRQRVSSYFQKSSSHTEHILEMLSQARELAFTVTGSPLEAALEESDAIKKTLASLQQSASRPRPSSRFREPRPDRLRHRAEPRTPYRTSACGGPLGRDFARCRALAGGGPRHPRILCADRGHLPNGTHVLHGKARHRVPPRERRAPLARAARSF